MAFPIAYPVELPMSMGSHSLIQVKIIVKLLIFRLDEMNFPILYPIAYVDGVSQFIHIRTIVQFFILPIR